MNKSVHVIINKIAKIFAIFLIISILSGIAQVLINFGSSFKHHKPANDTSITGELEADENLPSLTMDLAATAVTIKQGEKFAYRTNNDYISVDKNSNNDVTIKEASHSIVDTARYTLEITVPSDMTFSKVKLESGAGNVDIDSLNAQVIDFELGAGNITISKLVVSLNADIETGAGNLSIQSGSVANLDLDTGAGNTDIKTSLTGKAAIDSGMGDVRLNVIGSQDDYTISVSKGLGSISVNGSNVLDRSTIGTGINTIKVSGGIGDIKIAFDTSSNNELTEI